MAGRCRWALRYMCLTMLIMASVVFVQLVPVVIGVLVCIACFTLPPRDARLDALGHSSFWRNPLLRTANLACAGLSYLGITPSWDTEFPQFKHDCAVCKKRYEALTDSLKSVELSPFGRTATHAVLARLLRTNAFCHTRLAHSPKIQAIEAALGARSSAHARGLTTFVIVGPPRSGTTLLQRVLSYVIDHGAVTHTRRVRMRRRRHASPASLEADDGHTKTYTKSRMTRLLNTSTARLYRPVPLSAAAASSILTPRSSTNDESASQSWFSHAWLQFDAGLRRVAARLALSLVPLMLPSFAAIHAVDPSQPDEEILLLDAVFDSLTFETMYATPALFDGYIAHIESQTEKETAHSYVLLKRLLAYLIAETEALRPQSARSGPLTLVLKSPHHATRLDTMCSVFPSAIPIVCSRAPAECVPSFMSLSAHLSSLFCNDIDIAQVGQLTLGRAKRNAAATDAALRRLPRAPLHLDYAEIKADVHGSILRVLAAAGDALEYDPETVWSLVDEYLHKQRDERKHEHKYDLEAFGLTKSDFDY